MESLCKPLTAREQEVRDSLEQIIARLTQSISRLQEAQPHMRWQVRSDLLAILIVVSVLLQSTAQVPSSGVVVY